MIRLLYKTLELLLGFFLGIIYFLLFYFTVTKTNNLWIKVFKNYNAVDSFITLLYFAINIGIFLYFIIRKKLRTIYISFLVSASFSLIFLIYSLKSLGPGF